MSRSGRSDSSNTDPFNAGRPSFGDDGLESSSAGEQPPESWDYDGSSSSKRSKRKKKGGGQDGGTSSPSSSGSSAPSSSSSSHSSRSSPYSSSPSAASERAARENAEQEKKRQEQARREANQRKSSDYSTTKQSYNSDAGTTQQTTRREGDSEKKSDLGCSFLTFFFLIVLIVLPALIITDAIENLDSSSDDYTVSDAENLDSSSDAEQVSDAEKEEIVGLVQNRMDSLAEDEELIGQIAADFDRELIYYTDYDAEGLGLDSTEFAEWFMAEASFESRVNVHDDEGSANLEVTERDYVAEYNFVIAVRDYLDAEDLDYFSLDELDESQQAEIQALYDEMLESYDTDVSGYTNFSFDLVQNDDEWEIDEDSFEEGLYDVFINSNVGDEVDYEERDITIECTNLVYSRLSTLSEDEEMHAYLVEEFNDYLELYAHYDAEELGIDADAFADWYLANVWFTTDSVDTENPYMVEFDVLMMDVDIEAWWEFGDEVEAYLDEQGVSYYSDQTLTDAQKEHIQGMYDDFIANYDLDDENEYTYLWLELNEEDGEWVLDEDTYQSEMESALSF